MTQDTLDPTVDSVLSKLAELTVQLEGTQLDTLGALVMAGTAAPADEAGGEAAAEPSEADVAAVAEKVYALRGSMPEAEQKVLDAIVGSAIADPDDEVRGNGYELWTVVAPRGLGTVYSGYCKQMSASYGGRWPSTTLATRTAHSWSAFTTYTCWGYR